MLTPQPGVFLEPEESRSPPGLHDLRSKAVATAALRLRTGEARNCQNAAFLAV